MASSSPVSSSSFGRTVGAQTSFMNGAMGRITLNDDAQWIPLGEYEANFRLLRETDRLPPLPPHKKTVQN